VIVVVVMIVVRRHRVCAGCLRRAGCIALFAELVPFQIGAYFVIFVALTSVVSDFVTAEKDA
jgi:hypothetical protein